MAIKSSTVVSLGVVAIAIILVFNFLWSPTARSEAPQKDGYQAVFLTNNQVYFGKLQLGSAHYILTDIYYLQTQRILQPKGGDQGSETKLIKFGEELHGPEDAMYISKDNLLYWENLKDAGKIVTAIKQFKTQAAEKKPAEAAAK